MSIDDVFKAMKKEKEDLTIEYAVKLLLSKGGFDSHSVNEIIDWVKLGIETRHCLTHLFCRKYIYYPVSDIELRRIVRMSLSHSQYLDPEYRSKDAYIISEVIKSAKSMRDYFNSTVFKKNKLIKCQS